MDKILNYINGEFIESLDKSWINNVDPSIGKVYSLIPDSEDKDIEQAVQSAELAFDNWSNSSVDYRSKILNNIAKLILKNMEKHHPNPTQHYLVVSNYHNHYFDL